MARLPLVVLLLSAGITTGTWLAFMLKAPAIVWSGLPLPFDDINSTSWYIGPVTDTTAFMTALLIAYLALVWVVWTSDADLPPGLIVATGTASGVFALFTYALFAEDVNVVLANVWTYAVAGRNPYLVDPNSTAGNPFAPFIGWGSLEYVYGPAWLAVGGVLMRLIGSDVLSNVMWTKFLMVATVWAAGAIAWWLARDCGPGRPVAAAALIVLNPLLLTDGVMTPHLDLPMTAVLMGALLAWATRREGDAVALYALSIAVKLITAVLAPVVGCGIALSLWSVREDRRRRIFIASGSLVLTVLAMALLWPGVWEPFRDNGLNGSLEISANSALLQNVVSGGQAADLISAEIDPVAAAKALRWPLFLPFALLVTAFAWRVGWQRRSDLPWVLFEPMALLMLGYHLLFTVWLLPWHLMVALSLCLVSVRRATQLAGVLITAGGILLYVNAQWAWDFPWQDSRAIGWVLGGSLVSGPIIAMAVLAGSALRGLQVRPSAP